MTVLPDTHGHFGIFGGQFVPEALHVALVELTEAFNTIDDEFRTEMRMLQRDYSGRPTPLTELPKFSSHCGNARVVAKREDLNHTGSHKINNVLGQGLLARKMGKTRLIAETGAGQHGVATATIAALLGMECRIYMGRVDTKRQALNVARMQLLGAEVIAVDTGSQTLNDAMNEAMRDWVSHLESTHYLIGTVSGPHPFPKLVREFQRVISTETKAECLERFGQLPDVVCACIGGGSNAMGIFADFIPHPEVALYGFEAGGDGLDTDRHAASINGGSVGVLHGTRTYILQDDDGQTIDSHSISAGLDYPGVGPEHAWLASAGRAHYEPVTDVEAMDALQLLTRTEGILPAIESAHALAGVMRIGRRIAAEDSSATPLIVVNISGRGDKDVTTIMDWFQIDGIADNEGEE